MAQGDVTVQVIEDATTSAVDTAVTNLRVTANDIWQIFSINNGQDVMIVHIEEA